MIISFYTLKYIVKIRIKVCTRLKNIICVIHL